MGYFNCFWTTLPCKSAINPFKEGVDYWHKQEIAFKMNQLEGQGQGLRIKELDTIFISVIIET